MKKILLFVLLAFFYNSTNAQELISSSSGYAEKDGNKISWSIGEVVIGTVESGDTKLTQGFLQPLIIDIFPTDMKKYNYGTYFIEVVQKGTNKRRIFRIIKSSKNN